MKRCHVFHTPPKKETSMETNQFAPDEEEAALAGVLAVEADLESLRVRTGSGPPAPLA